MPICEIPWSSLLVISGGHCYNCCYQDPTLPLGNLTTQTCDEVWNGPVAQAIREAWLRGEIPPACQAGIGKCVHLGRV